MIFVVLGLGSLIFLSTAVIVAALFMRGQWDELSRRR